MKTRTAVNLLISLTIVMLLAGCHEAIVIEEPIFERPLRIFGIEVANEYDWLAGNLEVEVHLVDAHSGYLLACSGGNQGMANVDSSGYFFEVDAVFEVPGTHGDLLLFGDVIDKDIELWVIEDDLAACPGPYVGNEDDLIGISPVIRGEDMQESVGFSFGNVRYIELGLY